MPQKRNNQVKEDILARGRQAEADCKAALCSKMVRASNAIDKPWPKYVSTPGVWGWQKTAENYCVTSHAKILYFHTDTLFGDLVAEDGTFNKLACHCRCALKRTRALHDSLGWEALAFSCGSVFQAALALEKEIASLGVVRRRQLKRIIRSGRVTVDGEVVRSLKAEVGAEAGLAIDGIELDRDPPLLLKYHKPYDVICSMDEKGRQDLSDALPGQRAPWDDEAVDEARLIHGSNRQVQEVKDILASEGLRPEVNSI
ncbi:rluB [Symbiodinium natans]|uniref:RluB protein n=1 Tax=Symbiodinium natans TaxID=878477 RepID=A0A812SSV6_9DINO|nr:rluB [Symbiodinium natans]